jgi:D-threo-aldose 1-dehydrogenase
LELTEIGLGTAQFGNLFVETTDDASSDAVAQAWEDGIRVFDTAPHYGLGLSERRLGRALAGFPREQYVLSTKVGRLLDPSSSTANALDDQGFVVPADLVRRWDFTRDGIRRSVDESLDRLGTDRIDIAYLHDPDSHWEQASTSGVDALVELRDEGVVGAVGVGMNQSEMLAEFVRRTDVDIVMVAGRYTLADQGALGELLPIARARGVGVVAAAPYNSGLLSTHRVSEDASFDYAKVPQRQLRRARRMAEICDLHGVTLPDAAVQYALRHPAVVSVVAGARTAEQISSTTRCYRASIPDALWDDLASEGFIPRD